MEHLAHSEDTPAGRMATEALIAAAVDPDRFQDGTAFVAADAPDFEKLLVSSFAEKRPVAIIFPDGRELVATPQAGTLALILLMFGRLLTNWKRRRHGDRELSEAFLSVAVPDDYRVEIRQESVAA